MANNNELGITQLRHPNYKNSVSDWFKWRLAYEGGRSFINQYLKKFSQREQTTDFNLRKEITYCPRFAGAAIDDVKNSVFQRMTDIVRINGSKDYTQAINGFDGGVDLEGSTMNRFIGQIILPELLVTAKVGIYVDMPSLTGDTLYSNQNKRPYLYYYRAEDIPSWSGDYALGKFCYTSLLLRDIEDKVDDASGLVKGINVVFRHYQVVPEGVLVNFYNQENEKVYPEQLIPGLKQIPFVILEINKSLMEDIADYQIALMNLNSSDISYILKSNYPFYVEQYDQRGENSFRQADPNNKDDPRTEVISGSSSGRRYPINTNQPAFIHPSSEPLRASMDKEQQLKNDIRYLLNLSLSNLEPKFASAESKTMDQRSLESGLSAIGLTLEHGERQIASIWSSYTKTNMATVTYPRSYSLKNESERRDEAKADADLMTKVPSQIYQKAIAKKIAKTMVGHIVSNEDLLKIESEIDKAKYISADPEAIKTDLENGLVSDATASMARGYSNEEVTQAKLDHAERIARIQKAQTPPDGGLINPVKRGVPQLDPNRGNPDGATQK